MRNSCQALDNVVFTGLSEAGALENGYGRPSVWFEIIYMWR